MLERVEVGSDHDRVRSSYDAVAHEYSDQFSSELTYKPLDRAVLSVLLEQLPTGSLVADLGCGPGHIASWLTRQGASVIGIDLSPAMVEFGQRTHPAVEFREGDLLSLPAKNNEFAAVVCFYSIIHLRHEELPRAFSEFRRTLRPGGRFVLSFHVGTEVRHSSEWLGHDVDLDFRFFERGTVNLLLEKSGLAVEATLERTNYPQEVPTRRAYVMGIRP